MSRLGHFCEAIAVGRVAQHQGRVAQPPSLAAIASPLLLRSPSLALALALWAGLAAVSGAGCAEAPGARPDSGADAGHDNGTTNCLLNTICDSDGQAVRRCDPQGSGPVIEACGLDQTCSRGRCTTPACAAAETVASFAGCLFYAADVANVTSELSQTTTILVTNPGSVPVGVDLQLRDAGQPWSSSQSITIGPGTAGSFTLPSRQIADAGKVVAYAYRLVSAAPVVVVVIQSDDSTQSSTSSAGTMVLPAHGLGETYLATTFSQIDTPQLDAVPGSRGGAGAITIVATQDGTTVTLTPSKKALAVDLGGSVSLGDPISFSLDDGDVYQLFSDENQADLSGSQISADRPIAVFSGNVSTTYGLSAPGINSPDLASEQLLPVTEWGLRYVAAWLPPQQAVCNSLLGGVGSGLWRIVASANLTQVTFDNSANLTGLPASLMMDQGDVQQLLVSGAGDFTVTANHPISVMQGMDCEPTLSSAVAADSMISDFLFALPPNFDHELAIVRPISSSTDPVALDGTPLASSLFAPAGRDFEVARVSVPACYSGPASCLHRLRGLQFGVTLRGMDVACSYALTAASWTKCIDTGSQCTN